MYRILQCTDCHFSEDSVDFGNDHERETKHLLKKLVKDTNPNLLVFTGDLFFIPTKISYVQSILRFLDTLNTPYILSFGNHDESWEISKDEILECMKKTKYGISHSCDEVFSIEGCPFDLIVMDSHSYDFKKNYYEFFTTEQVTWYKEACSSKNNLLFCHIPLQEYQVAIEEGLPIIDGVKKEGICIQGENTHIFDAMLQIGKTKGVFVGHDHSNSYSQMKDGILLAYGLHSGYSKSYYQDLTSSKGGRIIDILDEESFETKLYKCIDLD